MVICPWLFVFYLFCSKFKRFHREDKGVTAEEADALNGKISFKSPIGAALMGKKRGDTVEVVTPKGKNQFEIIDFK